MSPSVPSGLIGSLNFELYLDLVGVVPRGFGTKVSGPGLDN